MVVMTHLHRDHVGWNLLAQGDRHVPTFPNARYWMSATDWEACRQPDVQPVRFPNAPDCVWPLSELGLVELMRGEHTLTRDLTAVPTPGHTPGHTLHVVHDHGDRVLLFGDAMYCPHQMSNTDWAAASDVDPPLANRTLERFVCDLEKNGGAALGCHFPELVAARAFTTGR